MNNDHDDELAVLAVKPNKAAKLAGCGRNAIYDAMDSGDLPAHRLRSAVLIEVSDLKRWIANLPRRETKVDRIVKPALETAAAEI
jgi:excisionase family DNA binding protein